MERLLITISSTIHKDLPHLFEDTLKTEISSLSTKLGQVVKTSVVEVLPKEFVGTNFQVGPFKAFQESPDWKQIYCGARFSIAQAAFSSSSSSLTSRFVRSCHCMASYGLHTA